MSLDSLNDCGSSHKYRTEIPNIIFHLGLSPYEFALYCLYKKIAGDGGHCFRRGKTLAQEIGISERLLREVKKNLCIPRPELDGISLITITPRFKPGTKERDTDIVTMNDIWPINYQKLGTSGTKCLTPPAFSAEPPAPRAEKEEPPKKIPKEEHIPAPRKPAKPPVSPEAKRVVCSLLEQLKKKHPKLKTPNVERWEREVEDLMCLDSRTPEDLLSVIEWAFSQEDNFWPTALMNPKALRGLFDRAWLRMNHRSKEEKAKHEAQRTAQLAQDNRAWAESILPPLKFPNSEQKMRLSDNLVWVINYREEFPVPFSDPNFKSIITTKLKTWQIR